VWVLECKRVKSRIVVCIGLVRSKSKTITVYCNMIVYNFS